MSVGRLRSGRGAAPRCLRGLSHRRAGASAGPSRGGPGSTSPRRLAARPGGQHPRRPPSGARPRSVLTAVSQWGCTSRPPRCMPSLRHRHPATPPRPPPAPSSPRGPRCAGRTSPARRSAAPTRQPHPRACRSELAARHDHPRAPSGPAPTPWSTTSRTSTAPPTRWGRHPQLPAQVPLPPARLADHPLTEVLSPASCPPGAAENLAPTALRRGDCRPRQTSDRDIRTGQQLPDSPGPDAGTLDPP